jgi:hypothetical protein
LWVLAHWLDGQPIDDRVMTVASIEDRHRNLMASDRHRLAEIDALIVDGEYRPRDPAWEIGQALAHAAFKDPDCCGASPVSPWF